MSDAKLICLVTPGHLTSTPRLLKEADALHAAGYRVHVVHGCNYPPNVALDAEIARRAPWGSTAVDSLGGAGAFVRKVRRRLAQKLILRAPFATPETAARAHHADTMRLAAAAAALDAHYYIGHCLAGLAAAAFAAGRTRAKFGFDIEDFHEAETPEIALDPVQRTATRILQATFLPRASHLTAAAPLIAEQYVQRYQLAPVPVLNVFPLADAPAAPVDPGPVSAERPARLYWFSQTVGPRRGIEEIIAILGRMRTPAELHLRGHVAPSFQRELTERAARTGLARPPVFLPFAASAEMTRLAAAADLGLSTEQTEPLNRDICLANKIFVYLLAGVPQLMSNTRAQSALACELGAAALVGDFADPAAVARQLDDYFADPARARAARAEAWQLGQTRFNWDHEKELVLRAVKKAAGKP